MATAHIESKKEDIAKTVLMPGDPLRAKYIADNFLTDVKIINKVRNMYAYTGKYKGKLVTIFPSGMGMASMGIYAYELFNIYDVSTIIRIGTSGSNNKELELDDNFNIYGFSPEVKYYMASTKEKIDKNYIEKRIGIIDTSKFNLLISHDPLLYDLYSSEGYDMVLSGHLHGGIINIPFIGGLLSPDFTFFPKYYKGVNNFNNTNVIISRGLGFGYMIPIRVFNRGEVVIIKLMKNE